MSTFGNFEYPISSRSYKELRKVHEVHDDDCLDQFPNLSERSDVLRQRDRTRALRRQSVMRARRESGGILDHLHHDQSNPDDDNDDQEEQDSEKVVNGVGVGPMRYQYMTPEDFGDDIEMRSADILKAFKGLSSTHGIPHVSDARGNRPTCRITK